MQWCNQPQSILLKYNYLTSHMSLLCMNGCARIEANSTSGRKQEAWDDVAIPFHETTISTNLLKSLEHWNFIYVIKVKIISAYIVSAFLWYVV